MYYHVLSDKTFTDGYLQAHEAMELGNWDITRGMMGVSGRALDGSFVIANGLGF